MSDLCPQITVRRIGWTGVYAEAGRAGRWTPFKLLSRVGPYDEVPLEQGKVCATCGAKLRRGWLRYGDGAARYHCGAHVRVEDDR